MKTKQGTSTQKFVRKTSQSPWDHSRNPHPCEAEPPKHQPSTSDSKQSVSKNYYTISHLRQPNTSIRVSTEQSHPSSGGLMRVRRSSPSAYDGYKVQQFNPSREGNPARDAHPNKEIYIPIETASTLQSLPTTRKKGAQFEQFGLQTKRKQQPEWPHRDLQQLLAQNLSLQQSHTEQIANLAKLAHEVHKTKIENTQLQAQIRILKDQVHGLEEKLKAERALQTKIKASWENSENKRIKLDEIVRELNQNQLTIHKSQNQQLSKAVKTRQTELQTLKSQNPPKTNPQRSNSTQSHSGLRLARSTSIQDPIAYADNIKVYTVRPQLPPALAATLNQPPRYNCYIQTEPCKLEHLLKENEMLTNCLRGKDKTIKLMQKDIHGLTKRIKGLEPVTGKLEQAEKTIEELNKIIVAGAAAKLAVKYRYF